MITETTTQFLTAHPNMKYVFFGGKGGVGKTVMAGAAALWIAQQGKRTLLASTNPVHSLSSLLDQDVFGKPTPVQGTPNLEAYEIDTKDTIEKSKVELTQKIEWFLKYADIKTKADEFVESATMNPAFEESAMFENMIDLMFENKYEAYVLLPEALPIAVIKRFINWFQDFGIPVGGVIVNLVIDKESVADDAPEFVRNRVAMQDDYMEEIWRSFPDVRAIVPLFETEVRGVEMLERTAAHLFA